MVWIWSGPFGRGDEWMNGWNCGDWGSPKVGCKQDEGQFGGPSGMIGANLVRQAMERMSPGVSVTAKPTNGEGPNWPFLVRHQIFGCKMAIFGFDVDRHKMRSIGGGGGAKLQENWGSLWRMSRNGMGPSVWTAQNYIVDPMTMLSRFKILSLVQDIKDPHFLMEHQHQPKDLLEGIKDGRPKEWSKVPS